MTTETASQARKFSTLGVISKANGTRGKHFDNSNSPTLYSVQISLDLLLSVKTLRNCILNCSPAPLNNLRISLADTASGRTRHPGSA